MPSQAETIGELALGVRLETSLLQNSTSQLISSSSISNHTLVLRQAFAATFQDAKRSSVSDSQQASNTTGFVFLMKACVLSSQVLTSLQMMREQPRTIPNSPIVEGEKQSLSGT